MILKTNNSNCYFYYNDTKEKSDKFIDSPNVSLYYNDKIINNVHLDNRTNVIVAKDNDGITYVVDDGYRDILIKVGYVVYKNYDEIQVTDISEGNGIRNNLIETLSNAVSDSYNDLNISIDEIFNNDGYEFDRDGYHFTILLYTNRDIVKRNQERKINSLQFFPFDKKMDNFGTLYVAVYCQKIVKDDPEIKSNIIIDNIFANIIKNGNGNIKFVMMEYGNPLYYTRNSVGMK